MKSFMIEIALKCCEKIYHDEATPAQMVLNNFATVPCTVTDEIIDYWLS